MPVSEAPDIYERHKRRTVVQGLPDTPRPGWQPRLPPRPVLLALAVLLAAGTIHLALRARQRSGSPAPPAPAPAYGEREGLLAEREAEPPLITTENRAAWQHLLAAQNALQRGDLVLAEREALRALEIQEDFEPALRFLGLVYIRRSRYDQAVAMLLRALKQGHQRAEILNNLATALLQQGQQTRAEEFLREALRLNPDHPGVRLNLGLIHILWRNYAVAASNLEAALPQLPGHPVLLNNLAVCRMRTGQPAAARLLLLQALERDAASAPLRFNVAMTFALETNAVESLRWFRDGLQRSRDQDALAALDDPDFDPVRRSPGFVALRSELLARANAGWTEPAVKAADTGAPSSR